MNSSRAPPEIPDSEDDSPIPAVTPEDAFAPPASAAKILPVTLEGPDHDASEATSKVSGTADSTAAPSPRAQELKRKIDQRLSTIEHTRAQLDETLTKLSALPSFREQASTLSLEKAQPMSLNATMMNLPPEQQQTLVQAQKTFDRHIKQLGQYNQLKDIAMGMLGMIAEKEGKTLREVMGARDVQDDD